MILQRAMIWIPSKTGQNLHIKERHSCTHTLPSGFKILLQAPGCMQVYVYGKRDREQVRFGVWEQALSHSSGNEPLLLTSLSMALCLLASLFTVRVVSYLSTA